jgi:xanthine dehydrogenase accessory factor
VEEGQVIAVIRDQYSVVSPFKGVLRGLIRDGVRVTRDLKIGDVDPRDEPEACFLVSDKALAIGGGVLEAVLTRDEIRNSLFTAKNAKRR